MKIHEAATAASRAPAGVRSEKMAAWPASAAALAAFGRDAILATAAATHDASSASVGDASDSVLDVAANVLAAAKDDGRGRPFELHVGFTDRDPNGPASLRAAAQMEAFVRADLGVPWGPPRSPE